MPAKKSKIPLSNERGVLLIVVLLILLVTTILGLSAMKASGLEMQMSSNSREQLMLLEAAEYVIAQVTDEVHVRGGFGSNSLANVDCGGLCFDETCTGGYCFFGADPLSWETCEVGLPAVEPARDAEVWADGSGRYSSLVVPDSDVAAKYLIEFRCYAAIDDSLAMDTANNTQVFRITTLVAGKSGRSGVMLRVSVKNH